MLINLACGHGGVSDGPIGTDTGGEVVFGSSFDLRKRAAIAHVLRVFVSWHAAVCTHFWIATFVVLIVELRHDAGVRRYRLF